MFQTLEQNNLIQEVVPVFARSATNAREPSQEGMTIARAFGLNVHDSEHEDLQGINLLRLASGADLESLERDMRDVPGVEYAHRVPARWAARQAPPGPSPADATLNRQWGLGSARDSLVRN